MNGDPSTRDQEEQRVLAVWAASTQPRRAQRAQVVLLSQRGHTAEYVAGALGLTARTVYKWRQRFQEHGVAGLRDRARPGQPRRLSIERREEIVRVTVEELPPAGQRWTIRSVARRLGVTQHQVRQAWSEGQVRPHAGRFQLLDERAARARAMLPVGLCVCPPYAALVLELGEPERAPASSFSPVLAARASSSPLRALFTIASQRQLTSHAEPLSQLYAFVARLEGHSSERGQPLHIVLSSGAPLTDLRAGSAFAALTARLGLGVSAKQTTACWIEAVECFLERSQGESAGGDRVAQLGAAIAEYLARHGAGTTAPFSWLSRRSEAAPARSPRSVRFAAALGGRADV